ncbi:MAG TPA: aminoglycoside phosphotransferase [Thiolapillus brandeum]|uniref:Aminoglycoside phosphotransferase n=1 Tax=Thiolapillus brandeum TaxID=1076588 RepID=A0A831KC00_9GAMM|nr:aminoglycoside phosphotransferase [Thiolapillus brandeum]
MSERQTLLENWLRTDCGLADFTLKPASEDASFRRYFRVFEADGGTRVAMDAPPEKENCHPFVNIAQRLQQVGVHAPVIHAQDLQQGFLLLEDLGGQSYLDVLDADSAERLYGDALAALMSIQACIDPVDLPLYDRELLMTEMSLFPQWLLQQHLGLDLSDTEQDMLDQVFTQLVESALEQPQVFVHRDYHSRNLMAGIEHPPGVIDFQDAVRGPVTYDLVSLLRDCYISWPASQVDEWAWGYYQLGVQSGVLQEQHESQFLRWFDLMGAQRQLKAAGIFARLNHRDGKAGYLADIPRTLGYIVAVAQRRSELAPLADFIANRVLPRL